MGSCTLPDRRWTVRECQLAHADQDQDRLISLQCHTARHEVSTHAPNKTSKHHHIQIKQICLHKYWQPHYSYDFSQPEIELRDGPDDEFIEILDPIPCKQRGN
jgi:hypothetical protein